MSNLYAGLLMLRQRDEDTIELAEELAPQTFGKSPYVGSGNRTCAGKGYAGISI